MDDLLTGEALRLHVLRCPGCEECRGLQVPASVAREAVAAWRDNHPDAVEKRLRERAFGPARGR